ncbi:MULTISPECIES: class I SAM-dependent methyltransferase [unclassified Moorena]|uniref:methyltransferase domain-containing protein n=1 Tax=unclassified Moorena TaxID=2683338 RepID=UPI0013FE9590|nr:MULTISPECIES: class I SAM-dependent methyltransferase [unclassified Moorena]NEO11557.1 class I SAM-dependent methyltransferase [Moorena sp. SIO3E8]NEP99687.1 class I SAM-dependent methyltransferase [Moorena sp. SIO3F7]
MSSSSQKHYKRIGSIYDDLWSYSEDYIRFMGLKIIEYLRLTSIDSLVDLGCGTGLLTQAIPKEIQLYNPIICVDPSEEMLSQIPLSPQYQIRAVDAITFVSETSGYNKVYMKEAIHHVDNKELLFSSLFEKLTTGGIFLLILLPPTIEYPLFKAALERYERRQPNYNDLTSLLEKVGFNVSVDFVEYLQSIPKEQYLKMVSNRYMSLLSFFDDQQLEEGLAEISEKYAQQSILEFPDRFVFITATK